MRDIVLRRTFSTQYLTEPLYEKDGGYRLVLNYGKDVTGATVEVLVKRSDGTIVVSGGECVGCYVYGVIDAAALLVAGDAVIRMIIITADSVTTVIEAEGLVKEDLDGIVVENDDRYPILTSLIMDLMHVKEENAKAFEKLDGIAEGATKVEKSETNGNIIINGQEIEVFKMPALDKKSVGLGNVDNTADSDKPVSTAQQAAIEVAKAEVIAHINGILDERVALVFKGHLTSEGSNIYNAMFRNNWSTGWTWIAKESISYSVNTSESANLKVVDMECGDMLIAVKDHPEEKLALCTDTNTRKMTDEEVKNLFSEYFAVLQANVDGGGLNESSTANAELEQVLYGATTASETEVDV